MKPDKQKSGIAMSIKLSNAGLEDREGDIAAHGWLDLDGIKQLLVDDYQREVLMAGPANKTRLMKALENGERLPDIILGMRGQNFRSRNDDIFLEDKTYIIDGLQRISNMMAFAARYPERTQELRIGAEVRFGTTKEAEIELFNKLNLGTYKVPLSPNVVLRNKRERHAGVLTLYGLSTNTPGFPLYQRVQWTQRMARGQLVTALMMAKVVQTLHKRFTGVTGHTSTRTDILGVQLDKASVCVGLRTYRANIEKFFDFIEEAWGLRRIEFRERATQTKGNFLVTVARVIAEHDIFWDGTQLSIPSSWCKKFSAFPLSDPEVQRLAASGTSAIVLLHHLLMDHLNKGRRSNKLVPSDIFDKKKRVTGAEENEE